MLGLLVLSSVLAISPAASGGSGPDICPADFSRWFDEARHGRLAMPEELSRNAGGYRYVLINGLDIGMTQGCFVQNLKELQARGVPRASVHLIDPSASKTVAEYAPSLRSEIFRIASQGPEPLVIIAHSRGACDALAFALMNPEFIERRVRAVFLIQGPFGGSGAADYLAGDGKPIDRQMRPLPRLGARVIGKFESRFLDDDRHAVVTSLSRKASDRFWRGMVEAHREALPVVSPRVFYVTSRTKPSRHPLFQRFTASYVDTYYGPNDGLVALEDQTLPGVGTVLAVLDAGHTDLTHRFPSARPQQRLRKALVDAILMAVARPQQSTPAVDDQLVPTSYRETMPSPVRRRGGLVRGQTGDRR
ncbi:MAG: hypothetical protein U0790_04900 [Isosphaeraceae bacterium]